jgi:hypothetical protein
MRAAIPRANAAVRLRLGRSGGWSVRGWPGPCIARILMQAAVAPSERMHGVPRGRDARRVGRGHAA